MNPLSLAMGVIGLQTRPVRRHRANLIPFGANDASKNSDKPPARPTGALGLAGRAAAAWLSTQSRLLKPPRQPRQIWSFRSLSGKAKDEFSWGFWEQNVAGGFNKDGDWQQGRWQQWEEQGHVQAVARKWLQTYMMDEATFEVLFERYGAQLARESTRYREAVPPRKRLAVFLHWLAHGESMPAVARMYDIGQSTVHNIVHAGVALFLDTLVPDMIVLPKGDRLLDVIRHLAAYVVKLPWGSFCICCTRWYTSCSITVSFSVLQLNLPEAVAGSGAASSRFGAFFLPIRSAAAAWATAGEQAVLGSAAVV